MINPPSTFNKFYRFGIKPVLDRLVATIVLLIFSPILLIVAIAIFLRMGQIFTFYKFRTMTNDRDADGNLLSDEERLTAIGQLLRKTSLDELPQVWNVLKGDMSFVGPRPLMVQYLERYSPEQARRHDVMPGITGWAQINGRNTISWEQKLKLDVWYVDNCSLWLDIKILFLTLWKVFKKEGISQQNHATIEEFMGNESIENPHNIKLHPHGIIPTHKA
jgi:lipopolysaccharide/colanic/teichoic acid biosynthesis glycosyltransferase